MVQSTEDVPVLPGSHPGDVASPLRQGLAYGLAMLALLLLRATAILLLLSPAILLTFWLRG